MCLTQRKTAQNKTFRYAGQRIILVSRSSSQILISLIITNIKRRIAPGSPKQHIL